jgi:hypothetical protein
MGDQASVGSEEKATDQLPVVPVDEDLTEEDLRLLDDFASGYDDESDGDPETEEQDGEFAGQEEAGQGNGIDDGSPGDGKVGKPAESKDPPSSDVAGDEEAAIVDWQKRANDNQAAFTRSQQELASIRAELDKLRAEASKGRESPATSPPSGEAVVNGAEGTPGSGEEDLNIQAIYDEYPEYVAVIRKEAERIAQAKVSEFLGGVNLDSVKSLSDEIGLLNYKTAIASGVFLDDGSFVEGHPDAVRIMHDSNKDFWKWYESKGYGQGSPLEIINRITEYKEGALSGAAKRHDEQVRANGGITSKTVAGGLPVSAARPPSGKKDSGSFEDGYLDGDQD